VHPLTFTLRPYQKNACAKIRDLLPLGGVLRQSPARSGKSKEIAALAYWAVMTGKVPLILTHRGKIFRQLVEHCQAVKIDAKSGNVGILKGHCYVAMQQTIINRPAILEQLACLGPDLLIIADEAHRGDFNKTFDHLSAGKAGSAGLIGFTATPAYKWAKHLDRYYANFVEGLQIAELTALGNITPMRYFEMRNDLSKLVKANTGEFTEASQEATFDRPGLYDGLFEELPKFTFNKAIIFCASKKSCNKLQQQFDQHAGSYRAVTVYSGMAAGPANLLNFEHGDANVLISIRSLSEGYDNNAIDLCILWCAIGSLPLYMQAGARPCTPAPNKPLCTVIDFGGNNTRFGGSADRCALTMDRDWDSMRKPPLTHPRLPSGVAAIQYCPQCEYILSALAKTCSNCGYKFPEAHVRMKEGELVEIQAQAAQVAAKVGGFIGRRISDLLPSELALYAKERKRHALCVRVAKAKEQIAPGWLAAYQQAAGYKNGWAKRLVSELSAAPEVKIEYSDLVCK